MTSSEVTTALQGRTARPCGHLGTGGAELTVRVPDSVDRVLMCGGKPLQTRETVCGCSPEEITSPWNLFAKHGGYNSHVNFSELVAQFPSCVSGPNGSVARWEVVPAKAHWQKKAEYSTTLLPMFTSVLVAFGHFRTFPGHFPREGGTRILRSILGLVRQWIHVHTSNSEMVSQHPRSLWKILVDVVSIIFRKYSPILLTVFICARSTTASRAQLI